jgi:multiple sugar transport system permease protein
MSPTGPRAATTDRTATAAPTTGRRPGRSGAAGAPPRATRLRGGRFREAAKRQLIPWAFLAPALIIFALFKFVPLVRMFEMSFYQVRPFLGDVYVGGANYEQVVSDEVFQDAIWHTVYLAVGTTVGSIVLGLVLALLLEGQVRHLWFIRSAVFLPVVAAMAVVAEVWRILYYPDAEGAVNSIVGVFGFGPSQFLNSADTSLNSVMVVGIWKGAPYDMMIFLAGLAGVDRVLYEAAAVDGASMWRRLWHVTFPALRPVFAILLTLAAIRGLRTFTEVFLLTNGGPNGSSEVMMTLIYKLGLERSGELGVASAGSVVLLAATAALTILVQVLRRRGAHR